MKKIETTNTAGLSRLALVGDATLLEVSDKNQYGSRTTKWEADGQRFVAFLDEDNGGQATLEEMRRVNLGGTGRVVLVRARKRQRKDGTPVPQTSSWDELDQFQDTITHLGSVNGVWNKSVTPLSSSVDGETSSAGATTAQPEEYVSSPHGTVTRRTRDSDMARLEAAVQTRLPRSVLTQMAAIMVLDGADPIQVSDVLRSRVMPEPDVPASDVSKAPRVIEPPVALEVTGTQHTETAETDIDYGPVSGSSSQERNAENDGTPASADLGTAETSSSSAGLTVTEADPSLVLGGEKTPALPVTPPTLPPPRRVRRCIDDGQIIALQSLADVSDVDRADLNVWAIHMFGHGLRNISYEDATEVIANFRSMSKEEGVAVFREQVEEAKL